MIAVYLLSSIVLLCSAILIARKIEENQIHIQILITGIIVYGQICLVGRLLSLLSVLSNPVAWIVCDLLFLLVSLKLLGYSLNHLKDRMKSFRGSLYSKIRHTFSSLTSKQKDSSSYILILFGVVLTLFLAILFVATVLIPQNADDFLTAYLPRIGYWLQADSLNLFEASTYNSPQSSYPLNAQIPLLRSIVLSGTDSFLGIDQWVSVILSGIALYGLSKFFGGNKGTSLFLAGIWILTPSVAAQIGIALTDLYVIFLFLSAVLLGVIGWREQRRALLLISSLSLALALGAKHTILFTVPALLLLALIPIFSKGSKRKNAIYWACVTAPTMLLFGIDRYIQNWTFFGHPFGDQDSFVLFTGEEINSLSGRFDQAFDNSQRVLTNMFLADLDFLPDEITDPVIKNFTGIEEFLGTNISTISGVPWLGVTTSIILIFGLLFSLYQILFKRNWSLLILVLPALSYLGTLLLIRPSFSLAFSRYILLPTALLLAASGQGFSKVHSFSLNKSRKLSMVLTSFVGLLAITGGTIQTSFILAENGTRPLYGEESAWGKNDLEMLNLSNGFANRSSHRALLSFVEECFDHDSEIKIEYEGKFPQGLLFISDYKRPITQHVIPSIDIPELIMENNHGPVIAASLSLKEANEATNFLRETSISRQQVVVFGDVSVAFNDKEFIQTCEDIINDVDILQTAVLLGLFNKIPANSAIVNLATSSSIGMQIGIYENPLEGLEMTILDQTPEESITCADYQMCTSEGRPIYILREIFNGDSINLLLAPMARDIGYMNNPLIVLSDSFLFGKVDSMPECQVEGEPAPLLLSSTSKWTTRSCIGAPALLSTYELFLTFGCHGELNGWYICS